MNDTDFHREFENAARAHQSAAISILHFINDCERRKSFLDLGYSSIFSYLVRGLKYSSSTAGRLIQAARCIRENPEVRRMLENREVSITSISQVATILDPHNKRPILERMKGASWREVERIAREYRPPVELRDRVAPVRVATENGDRNMVLIQFLARDEYAEVLDEVRNLLPANMSLGDVSEVVLREYHKRHSVVARQQRREAKKGATTPDSHRWECEAASDKKIRSTSPDSHQWECDANTHSRHIPDEVRDVIFIRDGGRCTFVAPDGTRCQCRRGLEVDHINPFANGGRPEATNLRLLCGAHNRRAAELTMGAHVMQPYWRQS